MREGRGEQGAREHEDGQPGVLRVSQTREQIRSFYNRISGVYDALAHRAEEPVRQAGLDLLDAREGERVLEVGFGTGHCLVDLAGAVGPRGRVYGVDLADRMVARAGALVEARGVADRVRTLCGDAARLPFRDHTFDAVFMSFTLELFDTPDIPVVLGECRRVLAPGGRIAVVGMSKEQPDDPLVKAFEWTHQHFPNFLDCRPIFVERALAQAGFEVVSASLEHRWVPVEVVLARPAVGTVPTAD